MRLSNACLYLVVNFSFKFLANFVFNSITISLSDAFKFFAISIVNGPVPGPYSTITKFLILKSTKESIFFAKYFF